MLNKIITNKLIIIIFLSATLVIALIMSTITQYKSDVIKKETYLLHALNLKNEIKNEIKNKQNSTLFIALSLSINDSIIEALKDDDNTLLKLNSFSELLKENTQYKNIWFQIITNDGNVFYRSCKKQSHSDLVGKRLDVQEMIKSPKIMSTISTGIFDMTFKTMLPIYDGKEFIGIFEIISHFNSITKDLSEERETDSVILVDKKYKKQLIQPFTKLFIDDYYVANLDATKSNMKYIKDKDPKNFINQEYNYKIDNQLNKFIVTYNINDVDNNFMATIITFTELSSINIDKIHQLENNMLFFTVLMLLIILMIFYYLLSNKHSKELDNKVIIRTKELNKEKEYIQSILDTNPSMILILDDSEIINANKSFLSFFKYENIEMFNIQNKCISSYFLSIDGNNFDHEAIILERNWIMHLLQKDKKEHLIEMKIDSNIYYFILVIKFIKSSNEILLTFQDITDLKAKDTMLNEQSKLASMGEMIANIAHQWRQPLSVISTSSTSMIIQKDLDILDDKSFVEICENINNSAQYLSNTINDFQNFIKGDHVKEKFNLSKNIDSFLTLVNSSIIKNNIKMNINLEEGIVINSYSNELLQCLINIFNNAKDAFNENEIKKKIFIVTAKTTSTNIIIEMQDNAGGIPEKIINNIFEPYFTTKHQSKGTGLGLHLAYNFITEGMQGKIEVKNKEFKIKKTKYYGALFTIKIPKEL